MSPADAAAGRTDRPVAGFRRRAFLGSLAGITGSAWLPLNLQRAMAATPEVRHGRLEDIEHVVILMQENRSFDHYFGTMPGVRGFDDPDALTLPDGHSVFDQPVPGGGRLRPFRYDTATTSAQVTPTLPHDWEDQHTAYNDGALDSWIRAKGVNTMGYFDAEDIPFHRALAENFTICDGYHSSVIGPTNPNRLYMWTGFIDPDGRYGHPANHNDMSADDPRLTWQTYPERLEAAGVSWRIYQEEDNYGDNSLEWFGQFAGAKRGSPLHRRAMEKKSAGWFEHDAAHDQLPQVSWLVAPSAQTEHPNWMPAAGAQYIASKLDAIAANPDVWKKTVFILTYDENDGQFDHVRPPVAPPGTPGEYVDGVPIGLGFRVPTIIVSPWTRGGYVASETFDHTSLLRLLERRFGVAAPLISDWRRRTVGDLTSAFRFARAAASYPKDPRLTYAAATASLVRAQREARDNPAPTAPLPAAARARPLLAPLKQTARYHPVGRG
ncbi:putative non-hemolytic phospholipase C [Marmoricola endophyticus]|uniref:phospholipase C n=1 Tax=Marmoricola endophyticus TaxID=2040280 RepID=A0A917BHH7_9ACTN|nr:alkaline phosphatase family protein [Marmoricola endophyticus]GGF41340.1 putative non-hemolytic phospholipase C [Marmoricola endophyticus]